MSPSDAPSVSVVIPVFNGAYSIARAIASVLAQDFTDFEIVVVNDGSTDATCDALRPFAGQIRRIDQANEGPAVARNAGIAAARGEYIAFLDADDAWLPAKLELLVAALRDDSSAVLAFSDVVPIDANDRRVAASPLLRALAHAPSMDEMLARWWPIYPSAVIVKRATVLACGGFDRGFRRPGYEDPLLWLLARQRGSFVYVDRPLVLYHYLPEFERMAKYAPGLAIFADRVRHHFGAAGDVLMVDLLGAHLNVLSHEGLVAMALGDMRRARRAFRTVLRCYPGHPRTLSRLLRTYLPAAFAAALSSPRRRRRWAAHGTIALRVEA
jgi:glycosyltransferase involved in cell wall biosynthesis